MDGFEDRLRAGLREAAAPYGSPSDLRAAVDRRVRRDRRARVVWGALGTAGVLAVLAGLGVLLATDDAGNEAVSVAGTTSVATTPTTGPPTTVDPCPYLGDASRPDSAAAATYVGVEEAAALATAEAAGVPARVVCRDGGVLGVRDDLRPGRLALSVRAGLVVGVEVEVVPVS